MLNFQLHPLTKDAFLCVSNPTLLPELQSQRTGDPWKHLFPKLQSHFHNVSSLKTIYPIFI